MSSNKEESPSNPGASPDASPDMDPATDPDMDPDAGFNKILGYGYFTYNDDVEGGVPGFTRDGNEWECDRTDILVLVSRAYSIWEPLPEGVSNPWEIDPYDRSADGYDEYIKQHTGDMVCFLYQIEGGKFTTRDVFNSPKYYSDYSSETSYNVTVPVTINGNPAEYAVTMISNYSAEADWEVLFTIDFDVRTVGFPSDLSVGVTELSRRGYMHEDSTWGLC